MRVARIVTAFVVAGAAVGAGAFGWAAVPAAQAHEPVVLAGMGYDSHVDYDRVLTGMGFDAHGDGTDGGMPYNLTGDAPRGTTASMGYD